MAMISQPINHFADLPSSAGISTFHVIVPRPEVLTIEKSTSSCRVLIVFRRLCPAPLHVRHIFRVVDWQPEQFDLFREQALHFKLGLQS
jgi:hypothetical protein